MNAIFRIAKSPVAPSLGDKKSKFEDQGAGTSPITVALNTQASGGSLIVVTMGEFAQYSAPTDNFANSFGLLQTSGYNAGQFPGFGLKLYATSGNAGGIGQVVSVAKGSSRAIDEHTLMAFEIKNGLTISSNVTTAPGAGAGVAYNSASINVAGPAVILALWGGDAGSGSDQSVAPGNGFALSEFSFGVAGDGRAYVQAAMAVRSVSSAGNYACPWTPTINQGAILAMIAVQA